MTRLLLALLTVATASAQTSTLRATLDLRPALEAGWLDPSTELVGLRGGAAPLSWGSTMPADDPDGDGIYTLEVPFDLEDGERAVEIKIKVDGRDNPNDGWQEGDNHRVTLEAGTDLEVALSWDDVAVAEPGIVTGTLETIPAVEGEGLEARDVHVWLPPGYADSDRRYPVLYLHDGDSMFGTRPGTEWEMDEAATRLIEAGEIEPIIIVAVANTDRRTEEYTPTVQRWQREIRRIGPTTSAGDLGPLTGTFDADGDTVSVEARDGSLWVLPPDVPDWQELVRTESGDFYLPIADLTFSPRPGPDGAVSTVTVRRPDSGGDGDRYSALLTDTVKPMIDARFRTLPDAANTGLGGSSLGGLITMHLGITRPDVFGRLIVASPSVWWDDKVILRTVASSRPPSGQRVWVDIGLEEGGSMVPDAKRLSEVLVETGWDPTLVRYVEAPGAGHETSTWRDRAPDMLRFLFPAE